MLWKGGQRRSDGSISDLPEIKAGAAGAWARAGKVSVRAGAEKCPEAALFHGAEAGTGGRSVKAPEGAEMIHTQTCRPAWDAGLHVIRFLDSSSV